MLARFAACLGIALGLLLLAGSTSFVLYRPDRRVPRIEPGASAGPSFAVQIIRPRAGLPLGGLLPPRLFGLDPQLCFDDASPGAGVREVGPGRVELAADEWELTLVAGADGAPAAGTEVVFTLVFQEQPRRVRCRPAGAGGVAIEERDGAFSGWFELELGPCEDAGTGRSLGWPSQPLVLWGSFDALRARD